jgi:hypothetical protein
MTLTPLIASLESSMIDDSQIDVYLRSIDGKYSRQQVHRVVMKIMCQCLELVKAFLPPVGQTVLDVAKAYWLNSEGDEKNLAAARVDCWEFLDQKGRGIEIKDSEDAAVRALLCVLNVEPTTEDFSTDSVRWFFAMMNRLGDYSTEVNRLMGSD